MIPIQNFANAQFTEDRKIGFLIYRLKFKIHKINNFNIIHNQLVYFGILVKLHFFAKIWNYTFC